MIHCDNCHKQFEPTREDQRFCCQDCRHAWHRFNIPGTISGVRALKAGKWSITIQCDRLPLAIKGSDVVLSVAVSPRPDAPTGGNDHDP
jgi:hypothetical protein